MTREDKTNIAKLIRQETGCGLVDASLAIDAIVMALKSRAYRTMDEARNMRMLINITWERDDDN